MSRGLKHGQEKESSAAGAEKSEGIASREENDFRRQELRRDDVEREKEGALLKALRMGDLVYYLYNKRVYPAWITSDGAAGDGSINLCYLDGVTARHSAVNKVARGIKNQQWWHDSKEALAAIEIDRRREKGII